ncbi:hypothetical protein [Sphingomonas hankookensis]
MDRLLVVAILLIVSGPVGWRLGVFWKEPALLFFACGTLILVKRMLA